MNEEIEGKRKMTMDKKYDRPIQVAEGIHWVGFRDQKSNLTCNPYLVVQDDQAILIDSGSRADFAGVMMKILQTGVDPQNVIGLIYQHYDPDLCGSMSNFIDMCDNPNLKIISEKRNNVFISFYIPRDKYPLLDSIDAHDFTLAFNGRVLEFIPTPYAHSPGSFITYDKKTKTLFTSDLFGSYATQWDLVLELDEECFTCFDYGKCPKGKTACPLKEILAFHKEMMPCGKALRYAISKIKEMAIERIAPQHGSILHRQKDILFVIEKLETLEEVGIDALL